MRIMSSVGKGIELDWTRLMGGCLVNRSAS